MICIKFYPGNNKELLDFFQVHSHICICLSIQMPKYTGFERISASFFGYVLVIVCKISSWIEILTHCQSISLCDFSNDIKTERLILQKQFLKDSEKGDFFSPLIYRWHYPCKGTEFR